jgi:regulator of cell morphogenesis and NO signaling
MTTRSPSSPTVGQLVAERPERGRLFEKLGIDYCCAGRVSLDEECAKRGLNPDDVRAQIQASDAGPTNSNEPDWPREPISRLADHIEATHHRLMQAELPRAVALVSKVARVHGDRRPELVELKAVFDDFAEDLLAHMDKEDSVLFPWIRALELGGSQASRRGLDQPIIAMMGDHDEAGKALQRIRELTSNFTPPLDACGTYRVMLATLREIEADMHTHLHKENNILFPRALDLEASRSASCSCTACTLPARPE